MNTINELYTRLIGDRYRVAHPLSDDLRVANELLHNASAFEDERVECLLAWCKTQQPCQFGILAASERRIHFCVLTDDAVANWSDEDISAHIALDQKLWKQRAAFDPKRAAHSFILVVASPAVALAAPDEHLKEFANAILKAAGWSVGKHRLARPINEISSGYLYLENPTDKRHYGFQFNIDFFACAGHERWWHDHRFPGGIAFTANSLGHMRAFREWYGGLKGKSGIEWALKQAMLTIDNADQKKVLNSNPAKQIDPLGRVTWLRKLEDGEKPIVAGLPSPLTNVPTRLEKRDWTKYEGYLHTDHAVREEFFQDRAVPPTIERPYLMDFTYIFDQSEKDFAEFSSGRPFTEDAIYAEIGTPDSWEHRAAAKPTPQRTDEQAAEVAEQLAVCRSWQPKIQSIDLTG